MTKKQQGRYDELYKKWSSGKNLSEDEIIEMNFLGKEFDMMIKRKQIRNGMVTLGGMKGVLQ